MESNHIYLIEAGCVRVGDTILVSSSGTTGLVERIGKCNHGEIEIDIKFGSNKHTNKTMLSPLYKVSIVGRKIRDFSSGI